jgi:hypothetical protein
MEAVMNIRRWRWLHLIAATVLSCALAAQDRPDFSGTWTLVLEKEKTGPAGVGRGGGGRDGRAPMVRSEVSGAAVNCGTECTIVQTAKTLTISGLPSGRGGKLPDVVLNLDGTTSTITQSINPPATYAATAAWDGGKLVVSRTLGRMKITQTISLEVGKLVVFSTFDVEGSDPVRLTYTKK